MSTQGPVGPTSALTVKPERLASANELEFCDLFVWRWGVIGFLPQKRRVLTCSQKGEGHYFFCSEEHFTGHVMVRSQALAAIIWCVLKKTHVASVFVAGIHATLAENTRKYK